MTTRTAKIPNHSSQVQWGKNHEVLPDCACKACFAVRAAAVKEAVAAFLKVCSCCTCANRAHNAGYYCDVDYLKGGDHCECIDCKPMHGPPAPCWPCVDGEPCTIHNCKSCGLLQGEAAEGNPCECEICHHCGEPREDICECDYCEEEGCEEIDCADHKTCEGCDNQNIDCACCGNCHKYPCNCCTICEQNEAGDCSCCSTCENQNCTCCPYCESSDKTECGCCQDCGSTDCTDKKAWQIKTPPWRDRGIEIEVKNTDWAAWDIKNLQIDPAQDAADYYLLEAIRYDIPNRREESMKPQSRLAQFLGGLDTQDTFLFDNQRFFPAYNKWTDSDYRPQGRGSAMAELEGVMADANAMFNQLIEDRAFHYAEYAQMAIGGELRHHPATQGSDLYGGRETAWGQWRYIADQVGPQAYRDAALLFRDFSGGSYGGEPWAVACDRVYEYLTGILTPALFMDRIFSLQHNGGVFLNKLSWRVKNEKHYGITEMQTKVLPAHANNPPRYALLLRVARAEVVEMWTRYWQASNAVRISQGLPEADNPGLGLAAVIVCRYCHLDINLGHTGACNWVQSTEYQKLPSAKGIKTGRYRAVDAEEYSCSWPAIFDPDGLIIDAEKKLTVQMTMRGKQYVRKQKMTPAEIMRFVLPENTSSGLDRYYSLVIAEEGAGWYYQHSTYVYYDTPPTTLTDVLLPYLKRAFSAVLDPQSTLLSV